VGAFLALNAENMGTTNRFTLALCSDPSYFSGTEPLIRVTLEGTNDLQVRELAEGLANVVRAELAG
jgi:hypothetical protein